MYSVIAVLLFILWGLYKLFGGSSARSTSGGILWRMYGNGSFHTIADKFQNLEEVTKAVRDSGLESSNIIFGIDYTLSNTHQGLKSFDGRSLHHLDNTRQNPYQQVIAIIGETLSSFDEDNIIPAFGFGELNTKAQSVISLTPEGYCHGVDGILKAYFNFTQHVKMSGPTSFAPLIYKAIDIVSMTKSYHILIIVADGQVSNPTPNVQAIVEASSYPLSIIVVGVGDGPWDMMREFDDGLPQRRFDNFQFVEFHKIMTNRSTYRNPSAAFALQVLMEIPDQFQAIKQMGMIG